MKRMLWIVCLLSACASTPPYGAFIEAPAVTDKMAEDAAVQLATAYRPASSRLDLRQSSKDAFGAALVARLRADGFAVGENVEGASAGVPLQYVVDQAGDVYRLTVVAGGIEFSRGYVMRDSTVSPAGAWSRRERKE